MNEINHWSQIDTPMLQKLREYLENTPQEQIERDWATVKAKGLAGPNVKEFIDNLKQKTMEILTTKQYLMCKLNVKFVGNLDANFSDDFILKLISSELQVEDLIEIMEDYADYKIYLKDKNKK